MKFFKQTEEKILPYPRNPSKSFLNSDIPKSKPYNIISYLIQNSFLDVIDSNGSWRIARIVKKAGDIIKVTFEGWSHRWDEANFIIIFCFFRNF